MFATEVYRYTCLGDIIVMNWILKHSMAQSSKHTYMYLIFMGLVPSYGPMQPLPSPSINPIMFPHLWSCNVYVSIGGNTSYPTASVCSWNRVFHSELSSLSSKAQDAPCTRNACTLEGLASLLSDKGVHRCKPTNYSLLQYNGSGNFIASFSQVYHVGYCSTKIMTYIAKMTKSH